MDLRIESWGGSADFDRLLRAIYRARWGVEIQFRAWKQAKNLDKALNRKNGEHHLMAILLTAPNNHLVGMRMARAISGNRPIGDLGNEKLHDALALHHRWRQTMGGTPDIRTLRKTRRAGQKKNESPRHARGFRLGLMRMAQTPNPIGPSGESGRRSSAENDTVFSV